MSIKFSKLKSCLEYTDTISFGKYQGKTLGWVIEFDPAYLDWCTKQDNLIFISDDCLDKLNTSLDVVNRRKYEVTKSKISKETMFAHHDQDDWWTDVPF